MPKCQYSEKTPSNWMYPFSEMVQKQIMSNESPENMYLLNGARDPFVTPHFCGGAAEALGFKTGRDNFDSYQYKMMFHGVIPDSRKKRIRAVEMTDKNGKFRPHIYEFDLMFEKSISVLNEIVATPEESIGIKQLLSDACDFYVRKIEENAFARVTVDGEKTYEKVDIVAMPVLHTTSRRRMDLNTGNLIGGDPHDHFHVHVSRDCVDAAGNIRTLDISLLTSKLPLIQEELGNFIVDRLRALGYEVNYKGRGGFEIAGIPVEMLKTFSAGHETLMRLQDERGGPRGSEKSERAWQAVDNLNSRMAKTEHELDSEQCIDYWKFICEQNGHDIAAIRQQVKQQAEKIRAQRSHEVAEINKKYAPDALETDEKNAVGIYLKAIKKVAAEGMSVADRHLGEMRMTYAHHDLIKWSLQNSHHLIGYQDVLDAYQDKVDSGEFEHRVGKPRVMANPNSAKVTVAPARNVKMEKEWAKLIIESGEGGKYANKVAIGTPVILKKLIADFERLKTEQLRKNGSNSEFKLSAGQIAMIEQFVLGKDRLCLSVGDAGTGKSAGMAFNHEYITFTNATQGTKYKIVALAPSSIAVNAIAQSFLAKSELMPNAGPNLNRAYTIQEALKDPRILKSLDKNTIVVLDESAMVSLEDLKYLSEYCVKHALKLVKIGDHKQFNSVGAGNGFEFEYDTLRAHYEAKGVKSSTQVAVGTKAMHAPGVITDETIREATNRNITPQEHIEEVRQYAELDAMRRGVTPEIQSLHKASRDNPRELALELAQSGGRIKGVSYDFVRTREERIELCARKMVAVPDELVYHSYGVTITNKDVNAINKRIRELNGITGGIKVNMFLENDSLDVDGKPAKLTDTQKKDYVYYHEGDIIKLHSMKVIDGKKVAKGSTLMIESVSSKGIVTAVAEDNGARYEFNPREHGGEGMAIGCRFEQEFAAGDIMKIRSRTVAFDSKTQKEFTIENGNRVQCVAVDEDKKILHVRFYDINKVWHDLDIHVDSKFSAQYGWFGTAHSTQGHTMYQKFGDPNQSGRFIHDVTSSDWNASYTNNTRSTVSLDVVCQAKNSMEFRAHIDKIGRGSTTDYASMANRARMAPYECALWPSIEYDKKHEKSNDKANNPASQYVFFHITDFMYDKEKHGGQIPESYYENIIEKMIDATKRFGSFSVRAEAGTVVPSSNPEKMFEIDASDVSHSPMAMICNAVVAAKQHGIEINLLPKESRCRNGAIQKYLDAAEKHFAQTGKTVSIGKFNKEGVAVHAPAPVVEATAAVNEKATQEKSVEFQEKSVELSPAERLKAREAEIQQRKAELRDAAERAQRIAQLRAERERQVEAARLAAREAEAAEQAKADNKPVSKDGPSRDLGDGGMQR